VVCVRPDELRALERCGAFAGILRPGCNVIGCDVCGCCYTTRKASARVMENVVHVESKSKDNVFVSFTVAVQQEVMPEKAYEAIYKLNNPKQQIDSFVSDVIRAHAPKMTLDELFESKDELALTVKERLMKSMEEYGFSIHQALVTDISPEKKVRDAMNTINANRRLRIAAEDKAEADKILLVKAAEAEAEAKYLHGVGVARQRAAIVDGLKEAVCGEGKGHEMTVRDITELLLTTQYMDTLEKMASGNSTTVFVPSNLGSVGSVAQEIRNGILQGNAAGLGHSSAPDQQHMHAM